MKKANTTEKKSAGRFKVDSERVQRLKKQFMDTPQTIDNKHL